MFDAAGAARLFAPSTLYDFVRMACSIVRMRVREEQMSWTSACVIHEVVGCVTCASQQEGMRLWMLMHTRRLRLQPDIITCSAMISACEKVAEQLGKGGPFNFVFFVVYFFGFFVFLVASGFCLLWLLAFVAFGFCGFVAFGFLAYPSICLYLSVYIYLSFFLSFFLAAVLLSLFASAFPVVFVAETKPNKEASKHELLTFGSGVLMGGALRPPPTPPRHEICTSSPTPAPATKSIFKVNSPVQNFLTNSTHPQSPASATKSALQGPQSPAPATKSALQGPQSTTPATKSALQGPQKVLRLPRNLHFKAHKKSCTCHQLCTSTSTKSCTCHEMCFARSTKYCTCHETPPQKKRNIKIQN